MSRENRRTSLLDAGIIIGGGIALIGLGSLVAYGAFGVKSNSKYQSPREVSERIEKKTCNASFEDFSGPIFDKAGFPKDIDGDGRTDFIVGKNGLISHYTPESKDYLEKSMDYSLNADSVVMTEDIRDLADKLNEAGKKLSLEVATDRWETQQITLRNSINE